MVLPAWHSGVMPHQPHAVVIGGGISGLVAALDLIDAGRRVTVVEASDRLGGKLRSETIAGRRLDVGAESFLAIRPEVPALLARLDCVDEMAYPAPVRASIVHGGIRWPMPAGTIMGVPTDPQTVAGLLTDDEIARLTDERVGEPLTADVSVGDFVDARFGPAITDRLVEPLLAGVYAGSARALSLQATTPMLWRAASAGTALIAGGSTPAVPSAQPVEGSGASAPRAVLASVRGGMATLPERLAAVLLAAGASITTEACVTRLKADHHGGYLLGVTGPHGIPESLSADEVVVATPPAAAATLLAELAPTAARWLGGLETATMAVLTFLFAASDLPELTESGFLVPPTEGLDIKAGTFSCSKWPWLAEQLGPEVIAVRTSIGRAGETSTAQRSDADLVASALRDIDTVLDRALPAPLASHVQRWTDAIPQYAPGHIEAMTAARTQIEAHPGLAVAGAAFDGVGIAGCVASAHHASQALARPTSTTPDESTQRDQFTTTGATT